MLERDKRRKKFNCLTWITNVGWREIRSLWIICCVCPAEDFHEKSRNRLFDDCSVYSSGAETWYLSLLFASLFFFCCLTSNFKNERDIIAAVKWHAATFFTPKHVSAFFSAASMVENWKHPYSSVTFSTSDISGTDFDCLVRRAERIS